MKKNFSCELSYLLGIIILAIGSALMTMSNFGLSMIVAPAYILHLKVSQYWSFFTFGMAEYTFQALLLLVLIVALRKFKWYYLFSFVTAVLYGLALDGALAICNLFVWDALAIRIVAYVVGILLCTFAIALLINTYIAPEVYELLVKELAQKWSKPFGKVKVAYDVFSLVLAVVLSVCFFGWWPLEGVGIGTVVSAIFNGWLIATFSKLLNKRFNFVDSLPLRKYFS